MSVPAVVDTVPTPNPDALMFKVERPLVEHGSWEFRGREEAASAPLAQRLFTLDGVVQVLIASRFVTVTRDPEYGWPELVPGLKGLVREHLASGDPSVLAGPRAAARSLGGAAGRVAALIDEEIRPAVAQDGGDVEFVALTDEGIVQLRLVGSCRSCPSSTATLYQGIQRLLMEEVPEVRGVEQLP